MGSHTPFLKCLFIFILCAQVFCLHVCMHMPGIHRGQKGASIPWNHISLELLPIWSSQHLPTEPFLIKDARHLHTDFPGALQPFFTHSPWQHHSGLLPSHRLVASVVLTSLPAAAGVSYPISSLSIPALWQFDLLLRFYVRWWIKSLHKSWGF